MSPASMLTDFAILEARAQALQHVGGGRDARGGLEEAGQHGDGIVDAGDQQHHGADDVGHLRAALGEEHGQHRRDDAQADQRDAADQQDDGGGGQFALLRSRWKKNRQHADLDARLSSSPCSQGEGAGAEHVGEARDGRHEGVFDGAFPALDGDGPVTLSKTTLRYVQITGADGQEENGLVDWAAVKCTLDIVLGRLAAMNVTLRAFTTL